MIDLRFTPEQFLLLQEVVAEALETNKRGLSETKDLILISFRLRQAVAKVATTEAISKAKQ